MVPAVACAATITVTSGSDAIAVGGACTLREAILASNTQTASGGCVAGNGADTIVLAVPKVTLSLAGPSEDADQTGDLDVSSNVTIEGQAGGTVIDGAHLDRVLDVRPGAQLTIKDLTLTGGVAPAGGNGHSFSLSDHQEIGSDGGPGEDGGAVRSAGVLVLSAVTISGNATSNGGNGASPVATAGDGAVGGTGGQGGSGGAIASSGSLTVSDSTISANTTGVGGAGGAANGGNAATIIGDPGAAGNGGRGGDGGGIFSTGISTVADSVITSNHTGPGGLGGDGHGGAGMSVSSGAGAPGSAGIGGSGGAGGAGGGVAAGDGTLRITGSLVAANSTGDGWPGGSGFGGGGGNGEIAGVGTGPGGTGGTGFGAGGGSGGLGGGLAALRHTPSAHAALVATSDTVTANVTGSGADAGDGVGAPGGNGKPPQAGGDGGDAHSGSGGDGGGGAGAGQDTNSSIDLVADTVVHNTASAVGGAEGSVTAGAGGGGGSFGNSGAVFAGHAGAAGVGGGLINASAGDSIIANNTPDQCGAPNAVIGPQGGNVSFPAPGCPGFVSNPLLGSLGDNGGPTQTFALLPGSPAIDEVPAGGTSCPATDQRGVARPQGAACDAGAYEHAPPSVTTGTATATDTTATITASVDPNQRQTTLHFLWGPGVAHGSQTADQTLVPGASRVAVSASLTGLMPGATYDYVVVATNADGTSTGTDQTFTTPLSVGPGGSGRTAPPALSKLTLKPTAFLPQTKKHKNRGTTVSYTDTQAATTTFTVEHKLAGVVKGKRCVARPKRRSAKKPKACTRYIRVKGSFLHTDTSGKNTLKWTGLLRAKPLAPGSYRLDARPTLDHVNGATVAHSFTIKRR